MNGNGNGSTTISSEYFEHHEGSKQARQFLTALEQESNTALERQVYGFRLVVQILEKTETDEDLASQLRNMAISQIGALLPLLKTRKREWPVEGNTLLSKMSLKLQASEAAVAVIAILLRSETEGRPSKSTVGERTSRSSKQEALVLLLDAAEACLFSLWRRMRSCENLLGTLLSGIAKAGASQGYKMLRVLLLRMKSLVLATCSQAEGYQGPVSESVTRAVCDLVVASWDVDRAAIDSYLLSLAAHVWERLEQEKKSKRTVVTQLNVITLLANVVVMLNKPEAVDLIMPLFAESLAEGDASAPGLMRLKVLDAVARMACLGCEKSYREVVALLTMSYLNKIADKGSRESKRPVPEAVTELLQTLPAAFLHIAQGLKEPKLRSDYRKRLLALCSDVSSSIESTSGRNGAEYLGPLLPAVAEICHDLLPIQDVDSSLQKLFRNLWFYIVLYGLAPSIQNTQHLFTYSRSISSSRSRSGSSTRSKNGTSNGRGVLNVTLPVSGPVSGDGAWMDAVNRLAQSTPPLVVSSLKWLEDEAELASLYNTKAKFGSGHERKSSFQRGLFSAVVGGRLNGSSISNLSGVKATYLLAVAHLEILRFSHKGGVIERKSGDLDHISLLACVFKYLENPSLPPDLHQSFTAIAHCAFDAALTWLEKQVATSGDKVVEKERVLVSHACFLIKLQRHREEAVRELADGLLFQLADKFPQVLWNGRCLEALLCLLSEQPGARPGEARSNLVSRPVMNHTHQRVKEWVARALVYAPCTTQGVLQEYIRRVGAWQKVSSLLGEIQLEAGNSSMASLPAIRAASAAATGDGMSSANLKSIEIVSMKRLLDGSLGGFSLTNGSHLEEPSALTVYRNPGDSIVKIDAAASLAVRYMHQMQQFLTNSQRGQRVDGEQFKATCLQASALIIFNVGANADTLSEGFSQLLRLLCWCPAQIFTVEVMETGLFVWTWLLAAAPQLGPLILAELVDAWLWTVASKRGLYAAGIDNSGPAAELRPHLAAGVPKPPPSRDPVEGIMAHRLWLGFLLDRFEVVKHAGSDQLLLITRMMQGSMQDASRFSSHPAAAGTFFTLLLFGLKLCTCLHEKDCTVTFGANLLHDRIYRAAFAWFSVEPGWCKVPVQGVAKDEAEAVAYFAQYFAQINSDIVNTEEGSVRSKHRSSKGASSSPPRSVPEAQVGNHPVWGEESSDLAARERRKLLLVLCQHEADRLETWAYPLRFDMVHRSKSISEPWEIHVKTAWAVDPRIALALVARFPGAHALRTEVTSMVQAHIPDLINVPEALHYVVTPSAVAEDSDTLNWLPHWALCSITHALEFLTPQYKGHPRVMAYVLRVMESYPPERVTFFMPQLVQALRYDHGGLVEGYLMVAARRSNLFAHILIWQLQGEEAPPAEEALEEINPKNALYEIVPRVKNRIINSFTPEALTVYEEEFRFFDKVTSVSGVLFPLPKESRRAAIRKELEKIEVEGDALYLPTDPTKLVKGIELDSGIPLQSAAKVPIMITFDVVEKNGDTDLLMRQACIFKVGDDCRQDVLALQVIALLKEIWQAIGLNLYLFPYGVLPTGYGRGIIEVVPNAKSRNEMGLMTDGGLLEYYEQVYGPVGSDGFERARNNFIVSSAGYAVASLLLQPKDRHNGNLLFDNEGRLVHIDFGFILETSPGGNMRFESAQFKLSHEMTQLIDPSGHMKSESWNYFVSLCVKGYLAARNHMDGIVNTVLLMVDSGLPCFSRGDPIGNLRKRFHPEMSEREAANFMMKTCADAYNKWSTAGYDLIQYLQQGIEK
jgi:phosphatidylinositol 4-kinase